MRFFIVVLLAFCAAASALLIVQVLVEYHKTSRERLIILQEFWRTVPKNARLLTHRECGEITSDGEYHAFQARTRIKLEPLDLSEVNLIFSFDYQIADVRDRYNKDDEPQPYLFFVFVEKTPASVGRCYFVVIKKIKKGAKFFNLQFRNSGDTI